jgi:hypothetical protein
MEKSMKRDKRCYILNMFKWRQRKQRRASPDQRVLVRRRKVSRTLTTINTMQKILTQTCSNKWSWLNPISKWDLLNNPLRNVHQLLKLRNQHLLTLNFNLIQWLSSIWKFCSQVLQALTLKVVLLIEVRHWARKRRREVLRKHPDLNNRW